MSKTHVVRDGDCGASIAQHHGIPWRVIWQHPENSTLKDSRKPGVLNPGDHIFVPDLRKRVESGASDQKHCFRRVELSAELNIRLMVGSEACANVEYTLDFDGQTEQGWTDNDGLLAHTLPPNVTKGKLIITDDDGDTVEIELSLGELDPPKKDKGVQARLANLGFYDGKIDGEMGEKTTAAIADFKLAHDLGESDELDDTVREKLCEVHEC